MKIVVCIKQVPDTKGGVKFNPDGTLDRGAMLAIMNPDDKAGLEAALRLKDEYGAEVTVVTMGLPKAEEVLREAMAMGADKGILVTDRGLGPIMVGLSMFFWFLNSAKASLSSIFSIVSYLFLRNYSNSMNGRTEFTWSMAYLSSCSTISFFFLPSTASFAEYFNVMPSSSASVSVPTSFLPPLSMISTFDPLALRYCFRTLKGWSSPAELTVSE